MFIGRFPSDDATCMAVKGLIVFSSCRCQCLLCAAVSLVLQLPWNVDSLHGQSYGYKIHFSNPLVTIMCLFYAASVVAVSRLLNISLSDLITCFHICWGVWGGEVIQILLWHIFKIYFFRTSLFLVGNSAGFTCARHSCLRNSATHTYQCVQ